MHADLETLLDWPDIELKVTEFEKEFVVEFVRMTEIHQTVTVLANTPEIFLIEASPIAPGEQPDRYAFYPGKERFKLVLAVRNRRLLTIDVSNFETQFPESEHEPSWNNFCNTIRELEDQEQVLCSPDYFKAIKPSLDIEKLKESFEAAIEDYHTWAYGWTDIESIFRYAEAAGKPFEANVTEADIINTLKDEYRFYKPTQRDIYRYIHNNPDLEERFNVLVEDLADADFPIDMNLFIGDSNIDEIIEECIREI